MYCLGKEDGTDTSIHKTHSKGFRLCKSAGKALKINGQNRHARCQHHGAPVSSDEGLAWQIQRRLNVLQRFLESANSHTAQRRNESRQSS